MLSIEQLKSMEDRELITEVLKLQVKLSEIQAKESEASQIHNYHFASIELLRLSTDHCLGSAIILSISTIRGELLVKPITISDGFSKNTVNSILDDLERTYQQKIELKPTTKRLK
jgi:hypothetical protein